MSHNLDWCVECGMPHLPEADCYVGDPDQHMRAAEVCDLCGVDHDPQLRCNDPDLNPYVDDYYKTLRGE